MAMDYTGNTRIRRTAGELDPLQDGIDSPISRETVQLVPPTPVSASVDTKLKALDTATSSIANPAIREKVTAKMLESDPELAAAMKQRTRDEAGAQVGRAFDNFGAAIANQKSDDAYWNQRLADTKGRAMGDYQAVKAAKEKERDQDIRARESDLRQAEFGLRERELGGRLRSAELGDKKMELDLKRLEREDKEAEKKFQDRDLRIKSFQTMVSKDEYLSKVYTPEEIAKLVPEDGGMLLDFAKMKLNLQDRRDARAEEAAERALRREEAAALREQARQDKKDAAQLKREAEEAELQVGGFKIAPNARPTAKSQEEMAKGYENYLNINGDLTNWKDLYAQAGTEQGWGTVKSEMDARRMSIVMSLKEMQNLGVLNGQDYEFLSKQLPDTTSWSPSMGKTIEARFRVFEDQMKNRIKNRAKARGYVWAEDPDAPAPAETGNKAGPSEPARKEVVRYLMPDGKTTILYDNGTEETR